jgi:hypothetical protein
MGLGRSNENRGRFVKMEQGIGEVVEGEADAVEFFAEHAVDVLKLGAAGLRMVRDGEIGRLADGFVKAEAGGAAAVDVGVDALGKHATEEEGVIGRVHSQNVGLFGRAVAGLGHEIGEVGEAARGGSPVARRLQLARLREGEEDGGDVIGERAFFERDAPQDAAGEDVEIERGGNVEAAGAVNDGFVNEIVIEDGVALGFVAQEGDEGNGVALGFGENADDEGKIVGGELCAAVRLNHVP